MKAKLKNLCFVLGILNLVIFNYSIAQDSACYAERNACRDTNYVDGTYERRGDKKNTLYDAKVSALNKCDVGRLIHISDCERLLIDDLRECLGQKSDDGKRPVCKFSIPERNQKSCKVTKCWKITMKKKFEYEIRYNPETQQDETVLVGEEYHNQAKPILGYHCEANAPSLLISACEDI